MTLKNKTTVEDYFKTNYKALGGANATSVQYREALNGVKQKLRLHDGEIYEYESPSSYGLCVVDTAGTIVYYYPLIKNYIK